MSDIILLGRKVQDECSQYRGYDEEDVGLAYLASIRLSNQMYPDTMPIFIEK
jgi:hypothetical protein